MQTQCTPFFSCSDSIPREVLIVERELPVQREVLSAIGIFRHDSFAKISITTLPSYIFVSGSLSLFCTAAKYGSPLSQPVQMQPSHTHSCYGLRRLADFGRLQLPRLLIKLHLLIALSSRHLQVRNKSLKLKSTINFALLYLKKLLQQIRI